VFDLTIPYDHRFFESLDRIIQREPWLTRDKAMIDVTKSVGIVKGKPFEPDARAQAMLDEAAGAARAWLDARYEEIFSSAFYDGSRWALPVSREMIAAQQTLFADPNSYPVDDRGGPQPPSAHGDNWVPTNHDGEFEVLFRFYAPEQPVFDKTRRLPDIEKRPHTP
jgi:hypothetical protein